MLPTVERFAGDPKPSLLRRVAQTRTQLSPMEAVQALLVQAVAALRAALIAFLPLTGIGKEVVDAHSVRDGP